MAKKKDDDIEVELRRLQSDAESFHTSEVTGQREEALERYYGKPYGTEVDGRSSITTREIYEAVEWTLPELLKMFVSGDDVVSFLPFGPEDVEPANQATDYVNYVFMRKNDGFTILHNWFKDALLQKNGIVKWWWDEAKETTEEEYRGVSMEQAIMMEQGSPELSLVGFKEIVDDADGITLVDTVATFKKRLKNPQPRVENVPPEEFIISRDARDIDTARFVAHRKRVTSSEMLSMGFSKKQVKEISFSTSLDHEGAQRDSIRTARHAIDNTEEFSGESSGDDSQKVIWLWESYFLSDVDGDGKSELVKAYSANNKLIEWELAVEKPFASITPVMLPHKFYGMSFADMLEDIQKVKTQLTRSMVDNALFMNHGRWVVQDGQANIEDIVNSRPNGIIRAKIPSAVTHLPGNRLDPNTFGMMDYMDGIGESRTGISKASQGLDPNSLRSNVAATTHSSVMNASMQKRELIARVFAETGVKDLFKGLYGLILRNQNEPDIMRLTNNYIPVDPTDWRERHDVLIHVGLGNNNKEAQQMSMMNNLALMQQIGQAFPELFTPENGYNFVKKAMKLSGHMDFDSYVTDPSTLPPPEPEPPSEAIQLETMRQQGKAAMDMLKMNETTRHNQATEEVAEGELVRKVMADEAEVATNMAELKLEREQNRSVHIGD